MTDVSATDLAVAQPQPGQELPNTLRPLAGIACCAGLSEREGLSPPVEDEYPEGHVLDGRFVLREVIGRSGMATIYRAEDREQGGRSVAVKIPLMRIESDPVSFGRFQREERIGTMLRHPLLLEFVPVDGPKCRPYIVTEYLDGCTLAYILHRTRPLPEADALGIASAICLALKYLHSRKIIHRDLKPGNVMICRDLRLCLMDFGLAAEVDSGFSLLAGLTPLFGTPEYMAPEQVQNKANDERTDIYSVGVILYQMLTGVLPFQAEDPWAAAQLRVNGDPVAPRSLNPAITPEAEEIVLHAMRRRPADRYPTAEAFRAELDSPSSVHVTGLSGRLKAPRWRISLQGTPILAGALIGAGALLFMTGLFFVLIRHR
ncbi:MAG: serine/threonine-protein kinase [Opitutaceae bacterium]